MPLHAEAERSIDVPAPTVYGLIADFENHHPRFMPPKAFPDFGLEEGGVGAGTVHHVTVRAGGVSQTYRMRVDEPEPGRVLTETEIDGSTVTTYTVDPEGDGCRVRVETDWEPQGGLAGLIDRCSALASLHGYTATCWRAWTATRTSRPIQGPPARRLQPRTDRIMPATSGGVKRTHA